MPAQCSKCGKPTNAPSGICAICKVMGRVDEEMGGKEMAYSRAAKEKKCIACGQSYQPKSNAQKKCDECSRKGKVMSVKLKKKKRELENELASPVIAREPKQSCSNGQYIITIDFSRYPKIHERLINLAHDEFRTPEFQLMHMLNQEFQ